MSKYVNKQALLKWLEQRCKENNEEFEVDRFGENMEIINEIKSGRFDVDESEIQRLRAALERIVTVYEECDCTPKDLYLIAVNEVGSKQPKVENEVHEAPEGDGNDA